MHFLHLVVYWNTEKETRLGNISTDISLTINSHYLLYIYSYLCMPSVVLFSKYIIYKVRKTAFVGQNVLKAISFVGQNVLKAIPFVGQNVLKAIVVVGQKCPKKHSQRITVMIWENPLSIPSNYEGLSLFYVSPGYWSLPSIEGVSQGYNLSPRLANDDTYRMAKCQGSVWQAVNNKHIPFWLDKYWIKCCQ